MPEAPRQLLIRADAGVRQGTGHVMRCLALGQGWVRAGGQVTFAMAETTPALMARLAREGFGRQMLTVVPGSRDDALATLALARGLAAPWIVADGYAFDAAWQELVHGQGVRLAVCDDYGHTTRYQADLILNQNFSADPQWYAGRADGCRLAMGSAYVLLRQEFSDWSGSARRIAEVATKVLVTMGGSDPDNVTCAVLAELRKIPGLEVVVAVGGGNPHRAAVAALVQEPANAATLRMEVDCPAMPELMAWADVAVTAGGSTLWELAYMGLPAIMLVIAENQAPAALALQTAGIARLIQRPADLPEVLPELLANGEQRRRMSAAARRLVDGRGVARVLAELEAA